MVNKIRTYCKQKELLQQGDRVLLGISGGADSVCLLFVLLSLAKEWELSLVPVHVNHHLRGAEADGDEEFCRTLCARQGLSLITVHEEVRALAKEHGWSLEEAGRNARYKAFHRIAEEQGCHKIAVAHHRNDQAETVLFHLFRGSRLSGLSGMEAKSGCLIRPLLFVSREEIEAYIQELGVGCCTDSTNLTEDYARNRIRQKLLPEAEEISKGATRHIAETADYLRRVEQFVQRETKALYERAAMGHDINTKKGSGAERELAISLPVLYQADTLLAEQVIYYALCEITGQKKDITSEHVAACLSLSDRQTGRSICLPYGVTAARNYDSLIFSKGIQPKKNSFCCRIESFPKEVMLPAEIKLPLKALPAVEAAGSPEAEISLDNGLWISFKLEETGCNTKKYIEKSGGIPKCTYTKWFDYDKISDIISLRLAMPQDTIALYADGRGKPLLQLLADAKVPKEKREDTLVLAEGSKVLWVPGIRGSEAYHVTEHTRRILIVTMYGGKDIGDGTED